MTEYAKDAAGAAKKAAETSEVQKIKSDLRSVRDSSAQLVTDLKEGGASLASKGVEYAKKEGAKDIHRLEEYVKDHPGKSLAFAALAGLAMTFFMRGSRR